MKRTALILISALLFFSLHITVLAGSYTDVTVSEAKTMIDSNPSLVILDVRTQNEYNSGHIKNAKLIPVDQLEGRLDELNKSDEVLVYYKLGGGSSTASEILASNDFLYVYNMLGGITAWMDEGYPVYVKYSSIQEAINNASEGDTIFVSSGTYHEHVVVNKTVSLVGENPETTIICGDGTQRILNVVNPNVNVTGFAVQNGTEGVYLKGDANSCIITNCKILNNTCGIFVKSDNNLVAGNIIVNNNETGIRISGCCGALMEGNTITQNKLLDNFYGVTLAFSKSSLVYHNNFINNTHQAYPYSGTYMWDNGYPSGGNYWSDYNGTDLYSGADQNRTGGDGFGDAPYHIYLDIADDFPLMAPISMFDAGAWNGVTYSVDVVSNSSVSDFYFNHDEGAFLQFNVTGEDGTAGFCRVAIPKDLLWVEDGWTIIVGSELIIDYTIMPDENYTYIYFTYNHSTKMVQIKGTHVIPEFPSFIIILPLLMIATLLTIGIYRRKPKSS